MLCYPSDLAGRGGCCMHSSELASIQLGESSVSLLAVSSYTVGRYPLTHDQVSELCGSATHYNCVRVSGAVQ